MAEIATYVFLDLEATGLPEEEGNKTKITELSMIAVKRQHLLVEDDKIPRVQQKLTLCLSPGSTISPFSVNLTGLNNELLISERTFDRKVFQAINYFTEVLEAPICLIAFAGNRFDYPVLKRHLTDINGEFALDVKCADVFHGFYDILEPASSRRGVGSRARVKRGLPWGDGPKPTKSYKLVDIYRRVVKREPPTLHQAETDCKMTLAIAASLKEKFVQWVDKNCCSFYEIQAMTPGNELDDNDDNEIDECTPPWIVKRWILYIPIATVVLRDIEKARFITLLQLPSLMHI